MSSGHCAACANGSGVAADARSTLASAPAASRPGDDVVQSKFAKLMETVEQKLNEGQLAEAQLWLSVLYNNPDLPADQANQITELLDKLAGTVIYSRQSYLEPAYTTQAGDTIGQIAQRYEVPWQLLAKINGLMPPTAAIDDVAVRDRPLSPGIQLKVVRGPFDAVVRLDRQELTLMVHNRYAARFPVSVGGDAPKLEGEYLVGEKTPDAVGQATTGVSIGLNDPQNPQGGPRIALAESAGRSPADSPPAGRNSTGPTLRVSDRDMQDLYGILSVGSRVTIRR